MQDKSKLPVAVIGAGPVGLSAAAHLHKRGLPYVVFEMGDQVGANMLKWQHVQLFSPWRYVVDEPARELLAQINWQAPDDESFPNGGDVVRSYLQPLATHAAIAPHIQLGARVIHIARVGCDKQKSKGRNDQPFVVRFEQDGVEHEIVARAVIDASGTFNTPNPLGANGVPAMGERVAASRIFYGIPDVLSEHRARYANKRVLVVGSGHSAFNALLDLIALKSDAPDTRITWAIRSADFGNIFGGGLGDQLSERGLLGMRMKQAAERGDVEIRHGVRITQLQFTSNGVSVQSDVGAVGVFDEIICATGFRPDRTLLGELRLELDEINEAPATLAPLIDPNQHSCGSVPPHGYEELKHPDKDVYIVGMKSYGRAPTFLMLTGYEQVRSIVAALAGDMRAAREVRLVLPETGVCSGALGSIGGCCAVEPAKGATAQQADGCCSTGCCATDKKVELIQVL